MALEDIRNERVEKMKKGDAQEIQDAMFRSMSAAEKIHLASSFFDFARRLGAINQHHGARRITQKNSRYSPRS